MSGARHIMMTAEEAQNWRPRISVVVPVYNVEKYLDRCVESLLAQTFKDIEIILVDDGSPDSSGAMCDKWARRDWRIRVFHQENGGLSVARNTGLDAAAGEYVGFVDSDDYLPPEAYQELYAEAKRGAYDVVYTGNTYHWPDGHTEENGVRDLVYRGNDVIKHIGDMLYEVKIKARRQRVVPSVCMGIFRRKIIEKRHLRFMPRYYSEDLLFNIDFISNCSSVRYMPKAYYQYCYNEGSITKSFRESKIDDLFKVHQAVMDKTKLYGLSNLRDRAMLHCMDCGLWITKDIILSRMPLAEKRRLCRKVYDYPGWPQVLDTLATAPARRRERLFMWVIRRKSFALHYTFYMVYYKLLKGTIFPS